MNENCFTVLKAQTHSTAQSLTTIRTTALTVLQKPALLEIKVLTGTAQGLWTQVRTQQSELHQEPSVKGFTKKITFLTSWGAYMNTLLL